MAEQSQDKEAPMLTITEASRLLGVSAKTLRKWSNEGLAKPARLPGRGDRRFSQAEIERIRREVMGSGS